MTDEELADDGEALGCLEHDGEEPVDLSIANPRAKSLEWTFTFPPQQHQFDEGDGGEDPREEGTGWTVSAIDNATGVIRLRRSKEMRDAPLPTSLVPGGPIGTKAQQAALRRFAASLLAGDGALPAPRAAAAARAAARRRAPPVPRARRAARPARPARGLVPRCPGAARVGQDLPRRAADHAPARAGEQGRDHGPEPQGDPQPARRGRARGGRGGPRLQGDQARRPLGERTRQDERARSRRARPGGHARRRHRLAIRARGARREARHARRRRGRPVQPRRRARLRDRRRSGSSCSATRCSSPR